VDQGESYASRNGKLRARTSDPRGIIIHTTGIGPWTRRDPLPYDAARRLYEQSMKYSPHYLVCGETGRSVQLNGLHLRALHVGSRGSWRYRLDGWAGRKGLDWWFRRFPGLSSPRGLFGGALWTRGTANAISVGIEVSPPLDSPRAAWKGPCWDALRGLVSHLTSLLDIPRDRYHVLTHSDAHPLRRITRNGAPWDPSPTQWRIDEAADQLRFI
jgi:N-acetyl-anhydromuramyl-L-alanine amidase AmpD